ncbi:TetR family transcriptional regulator [Acinetobacter baumannii]|nr:TetR family transcriptional regulator [Acinetobacter baumannii]
MAKVVTGLRPGGRSERIQTAVHQAVKELQKDFEQSQITIPMIAAQAGVTPSTIYRRWGDINQLFSDVALNELKPDMEPKDLGSFQQDITAWVEQYFEEYASEVGQDLLRDVLYTSNSDSNARKCETLIIQQLDIIQNRAKLRNELTIPNQEIIEAVIAPMLFRILFTNHDLSLDNLSPKLQCFIFNAFGVKPASSVVDTSLHGQPISSEFIKKADPDILYIVDRTAVMEHRSNINAASVENPLLRQTKAWKNGRVIFVDADAWYTTAASPTSLKIVMEDVKKGYQ